LRAKNIQALKQGDSQWKNGVTDFHFNAKFRTTICNAFKAYPLFSSYGSPQTI
jgi:hypothetical protein